MGILLTAEEKSARREARAVARDIAKKEAQIIAERTAPRVKKMTLTIEWKKSQIWGSNPHLSVEIMYEGTTWFTQASKHSASGCGYDKATAVIEQAFNQHLSYILWEYTDLIKEGTINNEHLRVHVPTPERNYVSFSLGGEYAYNPIFSHFGGKFERIASGKTFDVYQLTFGEAS